MPKQESKRRWSNKMTQMTGIKGTASISPNPTSTSNARPASAVEIENHQSVIPADLPVAEETL